MLGPCRSVEDVLPGRFRPPHCPWRGCTAHRPSRRFRYRRFGSYRRACCPRRRVPRFRCASCGRTFSRQSFATSYYLKRPGLLVPVAAGLVAGSAHRQIARSLGCAASTVTRLSARLGRHALLFQARALERFEGPLEPIVLDHFETFVFSQDDRLGIATAVGQRSWFVYACEPAPHRRAGRRAARRRAIRRPLPRPLPGSFVRSTLDVLQLLHSLAPLGFELVTDDHPAYPAALSRHPERRGVRHLSYRNPDRSPAGDPQIARQRDRALFAGDLLHKLWRHSQAHHRRETIAFGRRSNALLERAALMTVWRNFVKGVSERRNDSTTPAMKLGLAAEPLGWAHVLAHRLFPRRIRMPRPWMKVYLRQWITPAVGRNTLHTLRHAF